MEGITLNTIIMLMSGLLVCLIGAVIKNSADIGSLQKGKISKDDVCSIIDEKLLQQYKELSKEILFISRCVKCLAKDLKINIPLD